MSTQNSPGSHLTTPGTWLAEVPSDQTTTIAGLLNIAAAGAGYVRDRILIGVDADGQEPEPSRPRADDVAATAQLALADLIELRTVITGSIHAVAAAAIATGIDRNVVTEWSQYDSDGIALEQGIDKFLEGQN